MLKRDRTLQRRYDEWAKGIKAEYGSMGECNDLARCSASDIHLSCSELPPDLSSSVGETRHPIEVEEQIGSPI